MKKAYINTGFAPDHTTYVDTTDTVNPSTVNFTARTTPVKVQGVTQRMVAASLAYNEPFTVNSCETECAVGVLNKSAKVQINVPYGDSTSVTSVVSELIRILTIWQGQNLAFGVVPPQGLNIDED